MLAGLVCSTELLVEGGVSYLHWIETQQLPHVSQLLLQVGSCSGIRGVSSEAEGGARHLVVEAGCLSQQLLPD